MLLLASYDNKIIVSFLPFVGEWEMSMLWISLMMCLRLIQGGMMRNCLLYFVINNKIIFIIGGEWGDI